MCKHIFVLLIIACTSNDNRTYTWIERPNAGAEFGDGEDGETFHKYASTGFASNVDLLITGIPDGYSAAIYSDNDCSTQITLPKEIMGDTVFDAVAVTEGTNNFYAKVTTDDEYPTTVCVQVGNYYKASISSFEITANEGSLMVTWQTDIPVPNLDAKAKVLDGLDTVSDYTSIPYTKIYLNLSSAKIYSVTLKLTDKDGFTAPLITKSKQPLAINNATVQTLRSDGNVFVSNPGFSKSGIIRVTGINSGDFIGLYFNSDCTTSPIATDFKVLTSLFDIPVDFDDITNIFYVKRRPMGMSLFSCVQTSAYNVSTATSTPAITYGNIDYSVQLTISEIVGIINPIYEYSKKIGEGDFSSYIVSNTGHLPFENIGSQTTYQAKVRVKDGDGAYSDEFTSSVFFVDVLPPSPCDGLSGGDWIYVPPISDEIGPNLSNRLANWNGTGVGLKTQDGVGLNGFCVTKYPLKTGNISQASGTVIYLPWSQALTVCSTILAGARLLTNAEWMMIALNIEAQPENWIDKTTGAQTTPGATNGYISRGRYFSSSTEAPFHERRAAHFIKNGFYGEKAKIYDMLDSGKWPAENYYTIWNTSLNYMPTASAVSSGTLIPDDLSSGSKFHLDLALGNTALMTKSNLLPQTVFDGYYTNAANNVGGAAYVMNFFYGSGNLMIVRGGHSNVWEDGLFTIIFTNYTTANTEGEAIRCAYVLP